MTHPSDLTNVVLKTLDSINADTFATDGDRSKALLAAYTLVSRLETPWERIARMCMNEASFPGDHVSAVWKTK